MRKKKLVKRVAGIALTVGVVILAIVCVGKVNRIQNEKDIIGTWKDTNAEEVFTFQENGELAVSKDMPDNKPLSNCQVVPSGTFKRFAQQNLAAGRIHFARGFFVLKGSRKSIAFLGW